MMLRRPSGDGWIWIFVAAYFVCMVAFGAVFHPIEEVDSAEWDNYVAKVDRIRDGHIPHDSYRPLLYSIVSAGVASVVGDSFAGARITSSFFAALFVLAAFLIGRACFSSRVGWFAALATALNHHVIRHGVHATTDMMFAGLAALSVAGAMRAAMAPGLRAMVAPAVFCALAYFTRYTAVALLPVLAVPILVHPARSRRSVLQRAATAAGIVLLVLLPHFVLTWKAFGTPFFNENWKNLAFKLHANWEWTRFHATPYHGVVAVIASAPLRFLELWGRELVKFVLRTLLDIGGYALAGVLFAVTSLAGVYRSRRAANVAVRINLLFVAAYVLLVTAFFYTSPRFMLPILPMCYVFAGHFLLTALPGRAWDGRRVRIARGAFLAGLFLLVLTAAGVRELPAFVAAHPIAERDALVALEGEFGAGIRVLGTSPYMGRHVHFDYRPLGAAGARALAPSAKEAECAALLDGVDFVVVGRLTGRGFAPELLAGQSPHEALEVFVRNDDVVVYRVHRPGAR
jgi:hypothetical protein